MNECMHSIAEKMPNNNNNNNIEMKMTTFQRPHCTQTHKQSIYFNGFVLRIEIVITCNIRCRFASLTQGQEDNTIYAQSWM